MKSIKSNRHYIILLYINLLLSLFILKKSFYIKNFSFGYITLIFILTIILWWFYKDVLKSFGYKILFTIGILLIIIIFFYFESTLVMRWISYYKLTFNEINSLVMQGEVIDFSKFKLYINLILPISIILIISIMIKVWPDIILILMLTFIITFWYIGYNDAIRENFFIIAFINLFTYSVLKYIRYCKESVKKGFHVIISTKEAYYYLIFSSLIIATLCVMLPKNIPWKYSSEIKKKISDNFKKNEGSRPGIINNSYDLTFAGYGSSSRKLGGPIVLNDLTAFKVHSDMPYYLRGITKDYYDGYSWTNSKSEYILKNQEITYNENIISRKNNLVIYPINLRTGALIAPMNSYDVSLSGNDQENKIYYNGIDKTLLSEYMITESYHVKFYNVDMQFNDLNAKKLNNNFNNYMDKDYEEYRSLKKKGNDNDSKYDMYLQVPSNISPEIYKLVNDITKGCHGDFEKVYSIQKYLRDNYKYSINVSEIPQGKEFIDYFINEEKKGYCTYFATSATIFCRIAGIPARYVEGFNMTDKKDEDGLYLVSNKNAHAWTEILLLPTKDVWSIADCVPDAEERIKKEEEERFNTSISGDSDNIDNKQLKKSKVKNEELDIDDITSHNSNKGYIKYLYIVLGIIVLCFAGKIIYIIIRKYYICKNDSLKPLFLYSMKRLNLIGITIPKNATEMEFVNSLKDVELKNELKKIIVSLYAEVYANKIDSNIDKMEFYLYIEKYMKRNQGVIKYYLKFTLF